MSKKPASIVVSYRLSPAVIAKAIDGLKTYDKTADIRTISMIIKQATLHGINYLTNALPFEPSEESQIIVHNLTTQGKTRQPSIEEQILKSKVRTGILTKTENKTENKPESKKSIVTDFSIPKELLAESEEDNQNEEN